MIAMEDDAANVARDRARLVRARMERRLETLLAPSLVTSSGVVPLVASDGVRDVSSNSLLHLACYRRDAGDLVARLLESRFVSVSGRNAHGETALHVACSCGNEASLRAMLVFAQREMSREEFSALLDCREWRQRMYTALHLAVLANSQPCVELMLGYGCDARKLDSGGVSAAVIAANNGNQNLLRFLSYEWYAAERWTPSIHQKFPLSFRNDALVLLLVVQRIGGQRMYRDIRLFMVAALGRLYKEDRLRRGILRQRE